MKQGERFALLALFFAGCYAKQIDQLDTRTAALVAKLESLEKEYQAVGQDIGRVKSLETDYAHTQQRTADFMVILDSLRVEIAGVRGKLEEEENALALMKAELDQLKKDHEFRLSELEKRPSSGGGGSGSDSVFNQAVAELKAGRPREARELFEAYDREVKDPNESAKALLWIGKTFAAEKNWAQAATRFEDLKEKFPKSGSYCEALFLQAEAFIELKQKAVAVTAYEGVVDKCKKSEFEERARKEISTLKPAKSSKSKAGTGGSKTQRAPKP